MYEFYAALSDGTVRTDCDNDIFTLQLTETERSLRGTLHAKKDAVLAELRLTAPRMYDDDDRFLANGWQTWTTTGEKRRTDRVPGIRKLQRISRDGLHMAGISGDYAFSGYGETGVFHAWSIAYFRKESSRAIELWASRSERTGFTCFEADMARGYFRIIKEIDGQKIEAGNDYEVFDIFKTYGDYDEAMDAFFFGSLGLEKPKVHRLTGYTSWYNYFQDIDEHILLRDLNGLDRVQDQTSVFQIDDGFEPYVGDWLEPDAAKFPNGLRPVADAVHEKGYLAGLWLAPFCAEVKSELAHAHPDWMLRDVASGELLLTHFGWSGAYGLNLDLPEVRDYLRQVFAKVFDEWQFDLVKLDFLYSACVQPRNGKTRGQLMCEAVDFLRELCGDKLILGCGVPLGACWGVFDACRIGTDASKDFAVPEPNPFQFNHEIPSARYMMQNAVFRRFLNGRAFASDPDVFFLRDTNLSYTMDQKLLLAGLNDILGSVEFISDNVAEYSVEELAYLRHFFRDKHLKPDLAEFLDEDHVRMAFEEEGAIHMLYFDLRTGESNIWDFLPKVP